MYCAIIILIDIILYVGIQENVKSSGNFDGDSGLGTSKYKSTTSCTMSDVHIYYNIVTNTTI